MTTDYPDWTRLFHLVGTDITIPINIEASAVTLDVNLVATEVALDVTITAVDVTLPISIDAATVAIDVVLTAAEVTIDINFSDQSVAVFDAAKWFAHQAAQWCVAALATIASGASVTATRTVPAGKMAFLCGFSMGYWVAGAGVNILWALRLGSSLIAAGGFDTGGGLIFDVPFRFTAGQVINMDGYNYSGATKDTIVTAWGYDEDV